ncbi:thiamine phosphate synthase [Helicobacter sp. 11S02629-2]|uniref:thiamine phosphate synthase n=1 Tax=Helicobacter sp. 11S02629-2 TaxID=1476195 RepID=UPI000BA61927|nr:thiamine phosphate synthase [Helicobacter sp. 11S02629-2]PAF45301.1 hypothetical protein BKH40_03665 [Helicobacter sp. 11S02629-2]
MFSYLITSPIYHPDNSPSVFKATLLKASQKDVHFACFRLITKSEELDSKELALLNVFLEVCDKKGIKPFINLSYLETSLSLLKQGLKVNLHLKEKFLSFLDSDMLEFDKTKVDVICSTHDEDTALKALRLGANFVTLSPLFTTPNKGAPKGVEYFKNLPLELKSKTIALGGIDSSNIDLVKSLGVAGFAAIRYFLE